MPMVDEVFKNLVDQFSDPFTCLRELVQNAMDAGTETVEVRTRYLDDPGGVILEIRDFGGGMTRDIIDTKLTRLFASDKENDLTKIGKFGIGFVSVFSLKPELVIVDTGRDGEYWRIAFDGGTDFALFTLQEPIEGTSVRLHKRIPFEEYEPFVERCRRTLLAWCRHSAIAISFNGQAINCDLVVDSAIRVDTRTPLGRFNVGVSAGKPYLYGLYNSGLTLMEGEQETVPGVTYKVLSNHLEHTLTRDAVLKDENYEKVVATLEELIKKDLLQAVLKALGNPETRETAAEQARTYLGWRTSKLTSSEKKLRLFDDVLGNPVSFKNLRDCAKAEDRLFVSQSKDRLSERAIREGIPVLPFAVDSRAASLCTFLFDVPVVRLEENLAVSLPVSRPPGFAALESALKALLREGRLTVTSVVPVQYPDSPRDPEALPCLFALGPERLVRRYRKGFWATKYLLPHQLLLDVDHPLVRKALTRLETPTNCRTVAYALCKSALLSDGLDPATENRLLAALLERP
jgi:hypothetical protein